MRIGHWRLRAAGLAAVLAGESHRSQAQREDRESIQLHGESTADDGVSSGNVSAHATVGDMAAGI